MELKKADFDGMSIIAWDSEDNQYPGVYAIIERDYEISFNGVVLYRIDDKGKLTKIVPPFSVYPVFMDNITDGLYNLCKMYLSEWLYSKQNPVTFEEFQDVLSAIHQENLKQRHI